MKGIKRNRMKCVIVLALLATSCGSNMGTGVITGISVGASAGALANGGTGSLIGSAAGIITGGLIGAALDEQDRRVMERSSPRTVDRMDRQEPLTLSDVIKLSQSGVTDETIVRYLGETHSRYNLTQAQIRRLQDAGVSSRVITYMIDTGK